MSLSVYIHIPFCNRKCNYCAFYSEAANEKKDAFVSCLVNQISLSPYKGDKLISVFFGGGTPSVLSKQQFARIFAALESTFDISDAEITTELNPDSVDNIADPAVFSRFTRLSMGVQSFDDEELSVLGRLHNSDQAVKAYEKLRASGAKNVNIDLMLALPGSDHIKKLETTLDTAISLCPEHISAYILTPEKGTPLYEKYGDFNSESAPDAYLLACKKLTEAGYEHYEISNFAKRNFRCVHNMCYWTQQKYLAFGPSACGFDGTSRYRINCSTDEFIAKKGNIVPSVEEILSPDELETEKIMLSLRLSDGIGRAALNKIFLYPPKKQFISRLISRSLAKINADGGLSLTDSGFLVSNEIIRNLI